MIPYSIRKQYGEDIRTISIIFDVFCSFTLDALAFYQQHEVKEWASTAFIFML